MKIKILKNVILVSVISLFVTGCISKETKDNVAKLGKQGSEFSSLMENTLQKIEDKRNNYLVYETTHHRNSSIDGLIKPFGDAKNEVTNITKDHEQGWRSFEGYNSALSYLKEYFEALTSIASDDNLTKIQEDSQNLYTALNAMNLSLGKLDNNYDPNKVDMGTLATMINEGAKFGYERKREKYLKEITSKSNYIVNSLLNKIQKDFAGCQYTGNNPFSTDLIPGTNIYYASTVKCGDFSGLYYQLSSAQANEYHQNANVIIAPNKMADNNQLSKQEIKDFDYALPLNQKSQDYALDFINMNNTFNKITKTIDGLKNAHESVINSLYNDNQSNQKVAAKNISAFNTELIDAVGFYRKIKE